MNSRRSYAVARRSRSKARTVKEHGNKSLEASNTQASTGFLFGIALGSDLPASTKDCQTSCWFNCSSEFCGQKDTEFWKPRCFSFDSGTTVNTGGLPCGTNLNSTGTGSMFSTPAAGTGFSSKPGGLSGGDIKYRPTSPSYSPTDSQLANQTGGDIKYRPTSPSYSPTDSQLANQTDTGPPSPSCSPVLGTSPPSPGYSPVLDTGPPSPGYSPVNSQLVNQKDGDTMYPLRYPTPPSPCYSPVDY